MFRCTECNKMKWKTVRKNDAVKLVECRNCGHQKEIVLQPKEIKKIENFRKFEGKMK